MDWTGQVALVTGGAVRIGAAVSRALATRGCRVAVHYNRSETEAAALAAALPYAAFRVQGALTSEAECEAVMQAAWNTAGRVDILVNNASIFARQALTDATETAFETQWRVNCLAPMMLTRALARRRAAAPAAPGTASVVNLLDRRVAGQEAGCLPYLTAKKALAAFTRDAALELAPGVRVNGVAPGAILPPPGAGESIEELAGPAPLQRPCTPEHVAAAVAFLCEADAVTGQILYIDGGQHLNPSFSPTNRAAERCG